MGWRNVDIAKAGALLIAGTLIVAAIVGSGYRGQSATRREVVWLAGGYPATTGEERAYIRYLERQRRARRIGLAAGVAFSVVVAIRYSGTVTWGIGGGSMLSDVLFSGLFGLLLGSLGAELYRVRRPSGTARAAELRPHPVMPTPARQRAARILVAITVVAAVVGVYLGQGPGLLAVAAASVAATAIAEAGQAAVRRRPRPYMTPEAIEVDVRLRQFASSTIAALQLAAAILCSGWLLSALVLDYDAVQAVLVLSALLMTVRYILLARTRPPRTWEPAYA